LGGLGLNPAGLADAQAKEDAYSDENGEAKNRF
jgi:hypothetical protein